MALTYNIERDIRYNQGLEKATVERNTAFVKYLLQHTSHSIDEIAKLVNVPEGFVRKIRESLQNKE